MIIEYNLKHVPTIKKFMKSNAFIRGLMGPFGSGKSSGCVQEIVRRATMQEPDSNGIRRTRWAVIRNSYPQLRDTTIKTFFDWFPPERFGKYESTTHTYKMQFALQDKTVVKAEILFRALDRPDQVANLLSLELTGAWVNEAREVPEAIINALQGRVGRYPARKDVSATWFGILMDTNPPDTDSWWYRLFEEEKPPNVEIFKQPSGLSPDAENIENLPPNYYQNLAVGKDEDFINVYIHGNYGYVKDGRPVYPMYRDDLHSSDEVVVFGDVLILSFDFGLTPACVVAGVDAEGKIRIYDEIVSFDIGLRNFIQQKVKPLLEEKYFDMNLIITGDPAGNFRSQTDEVTAYDIIEEEFPEAVAVEPASSNSIQKRIDAVNNRLMQNTILINKNCKYLRKGFMGMYRFRRLQTSAERYSDLPEKNEYSHIHDALQYACMYANEYDIKSSYNEIKSKSYAPVLEDTGTGDWLGV